MTMRIFTVGAIIMASSALVACATPSQTSRTAAQEYIQPITGSAPQVGPSILEPAFSCVLEDMVGRGNSRIAISTIRDDTGKFNYEGQVGGAIISQGATNMAIRALGEFDPIISQVERTDMRIAELEMSLSSNKMVRDGQTLREVQAGQFEGTDYYISGSVTEFNSNIYSGGQELEINQTGFGSRVYVANVVVDLRLVRTRDLVVVGKPVRVEKQIRGFETKAGTFDFFGGKRLIDLNAGQNNQEPIQLAVRTAVERGILELAPRAVGASFDRCSAYADSLIK